MVAQSAPAEDREARLKKKIQNLESTVSQLSESISEIMTQPNQYSQGKQRKPSKTSTEAKRHQATLQSRQGKSEMTKPTPPPPPKNKKDQSRNYRRKKNKGSFSDTTPSKNTTPFDTLQTVENVSSAPPKFPSPRSSGKPMVIGCKKKEIKNINGNDNPLACQDIGSETTAWNQPRSESRFFFISAEFPRMHSSGHWKVLCWTKNSRIKLSYPTNSPFWYTRGRVCLLNR